MLSAAFTSASSRTGRRNRTLSASSQTSGGPSGNGAGRARSAAPQHGEGPVRAPDRDEREGLGRHPGELEHARQRHRGRMGDGVAGRRPRRAAWRCRRARRPPPRSASSSSRTSRSGRRTTTPAAAPAERARRTAAASAAVTISRRARSARPIVPSPRCRDRRSAPARPSGPAASGAVSRKRLPPPSRTRRTRSYPPPRRRAGEDVEPCAAPPGRRPRAAREHDAAGRRARGGAAGRPRGRAPGRAAARSGLKSRKRVRGDEQAPAAVGFQRSRNAPSSPVAARVERALR